MPQPPRADEAGGLYHALNRGNGRHEIFHKSEDYAAFERGLAEGLVSYNVTLFCFQLPPNHWHLVHKDRWNRLNQTSARLGLASTLRNRGRPQVSYPEIPNQSITNES
jgi:putative transposase